MLGRVKMKQVSRRTLRGVYLSKGVDPLLVTPSFWVTPAVRLRIRSQVTIEALHAEARKHARARTYALSLSLFPKIEER